MLAKSKRGNAPSSTPSLIPALRLPSSASGPWSSWEWMQPISSHLCLNSSNQCRAREYFVTGSSPLCCTWATSPPRRTSSCARVSGGSSYFCLFASAFFSWPTSPRGCREQHVLRRHTSHNTTAGQQNHHRQQFAGLGPCLLYTSPSPRDLSTSRMPSSA